MTNRAGVGVGISSIFWKEKIKPMLDLGKGDWTIKRYSRSFFSSFRFSALNHVIGKDYSFGDRNLYFFSLGLSILLTHPHTHTDPILDSGKKHRDGGV